MLMNKPRKMFRAVVPWLLLVLLAVCKGDAAPARHKGKYLFYVGTYTQPDDKSKGIYAYRFDASTGEATFLGVAAETINPSFVAVHPNRRFLYAVNEITTYKGQNSGAVSAFAIDRETGKLSLLNEVPSRGADPC